MINFKKIKSIVCNTLGVTDITTFSDEQFAVIKEKFGEALAVKFREELAGGQSADKIIQSVVDSGIVTESTTQAFEAFNQMKAENETLQANLKEKDKMIEALIAEPEPDTTPAMPVSGSSVSENKIRLDYKAAHNVCARNMIETGILPMVTGETFDIGDLKTEFGKIVNPKEKKTILHSILNDFTSRQHFSLHSATLEWQAILGIRKSVVQQFSPKWTPIKGFKFKPLKIRNFHHKINVEILPAEVIETWLMHLYSENMAPDQMPLVKYIVDYFILPQISEDIELKMLWKGKYVAATQEEINAGTPTPSEKTMNGIETLLVDALALKGKEGDTGINFYDKSIDLATCTDQEIIDHANGFKRWIAPVFKTKDMPLFCSLEYYERYMQAMKNKFGTGSGTEKANFGSNRLDFSRLFLTPIDGMYGSPIIFATTKENTILLCNLNIAPNVINDIQRQDYSVKIFGEFWLGCGFALGEAVFASVPADYDPQAIFAPAEETNGDQTEPTEESGL